MAVPRPSAIPGSATRRKVAGACVLLVLLVTPALSQSRFDDRARLGGPAPPVPAPLQEPAARSSDTERAELAAARLLDSGRADLAEGRPDVAQRVLEVLVARYPDSAAAAQARRQLYALYAGDQRISAGQPLPQHLLPRPAGAPAEHPPRAAPPAQATRADSGWRTTMISFRRLQDELRNGVGDRVFFGAGSADLGSRARAVITAQAAWLQRRPDVVAIVEGHADDAAAGADNETMAARRASAVRDRLVAEGIASERIEVSPRGAREPVAVCDDSDCAAQNRRVVLQVGVRRSQGQDNSAPPTDRHGPAKGVQR